MKFSTAVFIALACVLGLAVADFGYGGYAPVYPSGGAGGLGDGGLLTLIGLLFLIMFLFTNQQRTTTTAPTGGYIFVNVTK